LGFVFEAARAHQKVLVSQV